MGTFGYLLGGFTLAWAVIFVYVWSLSRKSGLLQQQLDTLQAELEADED